MFSIYDIIIHRYCILLNYLYFIYSNIVYYMFCMYVLIYDNDKSNYKLYSISY